MKTINSKYFFILGVLLITSIVLTYYSGIDPMLLIRPIGSISFLSALVILVAIVLVNYIQLAYLRTDKKIIGIYAARKMFQGLMHYFLIIFVGAIVIFLIQWIYRNSEINFRVEALFSAGLADILWFFVLLCIFQTYLVFSIWVFRGIKAIGLSLYKRFVLLIVNIFILGLLIVLYYGHLPLLPIVLSFFIYIFVLDLYSDRQKLNSTWVFALMVLVAGFTSLIIFSIYRDVVNDTIVDVLKESIHGRDIEAERLFSISADLKEVESSYVVDSAHTRPELYVKRLNSGYLRLDDLLFFNPLNGDYIKQLSNPDEEGKILWVSYYNKKTEKDLETVKSVNRFIVFHGETVIFNNTEFSRIPFESDINSTESVTQFINNGYSYIRYNGDNEIGIVNVTRVPDFLRPLSLFSLLFALTGIFVFFISLLNSKFDFLPDGLRIAFKGINTLKNKIQISIIGLFIISFLSLGFIAFSYIKNLSINYQKEGANSTASKIELEIKLNNDFNSEKGLLNLLNSKEKEEGEYFYLYDEEGNIVSDGRRINFEGGIFPLGSIDFLNPNIYTVDHKIIPVGASRLLATIFPVNTDSGRYYVCGYNLHDNFYSTTASNILSNFLNIYVFLFLLSGAIAIALANSISQPVEKLSKKLNELHLNKKNEALEWKNNDEIGQLISIYNSAIGKLDESRKIIAKIERDTAWKEMAKQVAHEIRNPLTPLKLNIQYLQTIVNSYPERAAEMVNQMTPGLIEQINNLDKISTEFSDFAKMPQAKNQKTNLNEIVTVVHDFFRKREDLSIQLYVPINDLIVFADKNHMVSILNNIIKNAIQAIPTDRDGLIVIDLYKESENAIIRITDNGTGIPDEMVDKVFSPNFTTKSSGTGLGLAICVNMIQAFNGKIYFETRYGEGTSFFVEIPLMRIRDNYDDREVVSLDD
jgi:signal transduction histidine kinase